jgi:hypothetical protein
MSIKDTPITNELFDEVIKSVFLFGSNSKDQDLVNHIKTVRNNTHIVFDYNEDPSDTVMETTENTYITAMKNYLPLYNMILSMKNSNKITVSTIHAKQLFNDIVKCKYLYCAKQYSGTRLDLENYKSDIRNRPLLFLVVLTILAGLPESEYFTKTSFFGSSTLAQHLEKKSNQYSRDNPLRCDLMYKAMYDMYTYVKSQPQSGGRRKSRKSKARKARKTRRS